MWIALLLAAVPPPNHATLRAHGVTASPPATSQVSALPPAPAIAADAPEKRPGAIDYRSSSGAVISIVPEAPVDRIVNVRAVVNNCSMGCCPQYAVVQRRVAWNGPTPLDKLEQGLALAKLTPDDVLYDLGCGDGRVVIFAAKVYGCRAVGLDVRPEAVRISKENATANGVSSLVRFYVADASEANLDQATVLYSHLDAAQAGVTARIVREFPGIRAAVAYQHKPPGIAVRKVGDFFVWRAAAR